MDEPPEIKSILISYTPDGQVCVMYPAEQSSKSVIEILQTSITVVENLPTPIFH